MNINYVLAEIARLPGSLRYDHDMHGRPSRPIVVSRLGQIVYYLELFLPHLCEGYAAYPFVAPAIDNIMPALGTCIYESDRGRSVAWFMLCHAVDQLCTELEAALAQLLGKNAHEMEFYRHRAITFGKAWADKDSEEQRGQSEAQELASSSSDYANPTDLSKL